MKARALLVSVLFVAVAALAAAAFAGTISTPTSTVTPGQYVLHNADNSIPAPFTDKTNRFDTLALCDAAARSLNKTFKGKCDQSSPVTVTIVVTSTCADEPAPRIYLPLVDLQDGNGSKGYELPEMEPPKLKDGSDSEYMPERDWLYVHGPQWPDGYPNCWVRGWEDPSKWRQNAAKDPGKVFMELITPENMAEITELPNVMDPMTTPAGFDDEWHSPEREAERHQKCQCYADDKTPCPPIPGPNCPAMVPPA